MATVVFQAGGGTATAPSAPTDVTATPGNGSADGQLDRTGRRRQHDHQLHRHALHRSDGAARHHRPRRAAGHDHPDHRPHERHRLHVHGAARPTPSGSGPASAASNPVTPGASPGGQWSSLPDDADHGLSSILTYNGKLVFWDGWQDPQPSVVWNPANPSTYTTINAPSSVFCDGAAPRSPTAACSSSAATAASPPATSASSTPTSSTPPPTRGPGSANMNQPALVPVAHRAGRRPLPRAQRQHHRRNRTGPRRPRSTTRPPTRGRCSPACRRPQIHEKEYPFSYLLPERQGPGHGARRGRHLYPRRQHQGVDVGGGQRPENGSSVMYRPGKILYSGGSADIVGGDIAGDHRRARHDGGVALVGPDLGDGQRPHLPHPHHAGRRPGARGRRRREQQPATAHHDRRAADRDLEPDHPDLVDRCVDGGSPQLPLDRHAAARRHRARHRWRPPQLAVGPGPVQLADLLAFVPVQRAPTHDHQSLRPPPPTARRSPSPPPTPRRSRPSTSCRSVRARTSST